MSQTYTDDQKQRMRDDAIQELNRIIKRNDVTVEQRLQAIQLLMSATAPSWKQNVYPATYNVVPGQYVGRGDDGSILNTPKVTS